MERPPRRLLPLALGVVVLATIGYLGFTLFTKSVVYYKTTSEVASMPAGSHVRLSGTVVNGSIHMDAENGTYTFEVTDNKTVMNVLATGAAPDTLKDGAQAVADGSLGRDGSFHATTVFAKCPSKFQASPAGG